MVIALYLQTQIPSENQTIKARKLHKGSFHNILVSSFLNAKSNLFKGNPSHKSALIYEFLWLTNMTCQQNYQKEAIF